MKKQLTLCLVILAAAVAATPSASSAFARGGETAPVTIDPPGSVDTRPFGINSSGEVVGLYTTADGKTHGFLLGDDVYTTIDFPGALRTNALAINDSGQIVGRYDIGTVAHGYLLSDGEFKTIDHPDAAGFTVLTDIDPAGRMAGRYRSSDGKFHGFTLVEGVFTTIDHLDENGNPDMGPQGIQGMAISPPGAIAGYYQDLSGKFHAFLLDDGVYTTIDPPNAKATGGNGGILKISPNGTVVGSYTRNDDAPAACGCASHGFVYRKGAFTTFDFPDAQATNLTGVNARGDVVGVYTDQSTRRHFVACGLNVRLPSAPEPAQVHSGAARETLCRGYLKSGPSGLQCPERIAPAAEHRPRGCPGRRPKNSSTPGLYPVEVGIRQRLILRRKRLKLGEFSWERTGL